MQMTRPATNMLLLQAAIIPLITPVEGSYISSRNKITKGDLRQAQARHAPLPSVVSTAVM